MNFKVWKKTLKITSFITCRLFSWYIFQSCMQSKYSYLIQYDYRCISRHHGASIEGSLISLEYMENIVQGGLRGALNWGSPWCRELPAYQFWAIKKLQSDVSSSMYIVQTEKYFWNLIKSNRNQIVFTIFQLIWNSKCTASVCCSKSICAW